MKSNIGWKPALLRVPARMVVYGLPFALIRFLLAEGAGEDGVSFSLASVLLSIVVFGGCMAIVMELADSTRRWNKSAAANGKGVRESDLM